ncbi:MAG: glycosyltransferase family 1 protein [Calditrichaeota bacterium]|nr:MAG: glycosyltransferase family 1 protein [Calditrichota bacterium]
MKIAIMGIRGIPANYGGFETFAEELAPRLVKMGHDVTVYGRNHNIDYKGELYKGVRIVVLPTIRHKYFDTVAHTFLCVLDALKRRFDVILVCNSANAIFTWIPRMAGMPVALNVDGLEWKRKKWNWLGRQYYKFSEWLATFLPTEIVTDARDIEKYYLDKYGKPSTYIPYGAPVDRVNTTEVLKKFGVEPRKYILYVSRFEPENNPHLVVKAFEKTRTDMKLVMVGDAPYNSEFIRNLRKTRDPRIIFTGYVFGKGYREFQSHAYLYIQATEVGGTHPALLEGMGHGNCVLANDVPEHREVLADAGYFFDAQKEGDLTEKIQYLVDHPEKVKRARRLARERIEQHYTWERIAEAYEKLFQRLYLQKTKSVSHSREMRAYIRPQKELHDEQP